MAAGRLPEPGVGAQVRSVRKQLGFSRRRVALNAGFSRRELASFERGRRSMSVEQVRSVAGSLGIDTTELVPDDVQPAATDVRIEDILDDLPLGKSIPELEQPVTPPRERRKAPRASAKLNRTFTRVWDQLDDVTRCCGRVVTASSDDDIGAFLADLEAAIARVRDNPELARAIDQHHEALGAYETARAVAESASWRSRAGLGRLET